MLRRYYVAPCIEYDVLGRVWRTWDVMRRELRDEQVCRDEATAVANFDLRRDARIACEVYNQRAEREGRT